ncbi:hypothetical protein RJ640_015400 [Escallonia rubra]|uniref:Golgin candidate 2 n=1 Tax=Escallonia rubra TaxID=112253 RepID=A0AA88U5Y4_9ASTE|nr:hypothetical protein RJ640_015400 [Escallonia rubra]
MAAYPRTHHAWRGRVFVGLLVVVVGARGGGERLCCGESATPVLHHQQRGDVASGAVRGGGVDVEAEGVVGAEDLGSDGLEGVAGIWVDEVGLVVEEDSSGVGLVAAKGIELEYEILEAEYSFITDKVGQFMEKVKTLEASIEMTQKEIENPTEMEVELKRRLGQLTDHLIQKQSQVEALSSDKAMLVFRIEAVSRLLDENKLSMTDLPSTSSRDATESGVWEFSNSKLRPLLEGRLRSGQKHLGSFVRQLDSIFSAGAIFLRRTPTARTWSFVYLACLHFWVLYILLSHSAVSEEARSGAVVSLENIGNTGVA